MEPVFNNKAVLLRPWENPCTGSALGTTSTVWSWGVDRKLALALPKWERTSWRRSSCWIRSMVCFHVLCLNIRSYLPLTCAAVLPWWQLCLWPLLKCSSGHRVPAAALRLWHVALLRRVLRRPQRGGRLPHRGGSLSHHDQLQQPVPLVHWRRRWRRGRGGQREQTSGERRRKTDRWRLSVSAFKGSVLHQH